MKDVQAKGEAYSPQKRTSILQNIKLLPFFLVYLMLIRIHNTGENRGY